MSSTAAQSVGVDISKDTLDVAIHPGGESFRITNNPEGHRALIKRLKGFDIARIVFEATGAYHRLFQQAMVEVGLPWVKVNPCQARRFAQATGKLAKTDRCDALMLARMGAVLDLETRAPVSKTVEALEGTRQRSRRTHQGPRRGPQPPDHRRLAPHQASARSEVAPDRRPDRSDRSTPQNTAQRRLGPVPALRDLDEHSRHRGGDRKRACRRDARARASRARPG